MILAPKYLPRIASTVGLFTRYGLIDVARQQGLLALPNVSTNGDGAKTPNRENAVGFRKRLVELGPAYIKLGQVLSTRKDLLPVEYLEELAKLQDDVPPMLLEDVIGTIEEELGTKLSRLFDRFDEVPLGSASLGQVHAAELRGGREVVVKVQRPNIRTVLSDDIEFFREFATFLTAHTTAGQRVDLLGVLEELERALADELDYRTEARNSEHFRKALCEFTGLIIPEVIGSYSTERVLTSERVHAIRIDDVSPVTRTECDFSGAADELTRAYLKQIAIDGHFHADPHPGNVLIVLPTVEYSEETVDGPLVDGPENAPAPHPTDNRDARIALLDFGMTARLSNRMREQSVKVLLGLVDDRAEDVADVLIEIGQPMPEFDRAAYVREVSTIVTRKAPLDVSQFQAGSVLYEIINASFQRGLRLPPDLALLAKTLVNLEGVTRALDPTFDGAETVRSFLVEIALDRAKKRMNPRQLYQAMSEGADLVRSLPHRLDVITSRFANSDFQTKLDMPQLGVLLEGLQKVANRVFTGLVLAGLLVSSAMLMPRFPRTALSGFAIAGVLGLYMVLAILWQDRKAQHAAKT